MMAPTIGRVVHYQSYGTPGGEFQSLQHPAIVTEVHSDGVVGLFVINPTGQYFTREVPFSETPKPGHWSWPPKVE
jgi:hypothetical protein